jgi:hypothetical protein
VHAVKAYKESRGIAPFIVNCGTRLRQVVSITPQPLSKQNIPPVPLNRRLDVSPDISGEEKNFFTLLVNEPQIIQPTA